MNTRTCPNVPFPIRYELPPERIAQTACEPRDQARLLVARREGQSLAHHHVHELPALLNPGDLLVFNDSRVLHARLLGRRQATGGKWEGLFVRALPDGAWELLCQTRGRLRPGEVIALDRGSMTLTMREPRSGIWLATPSIPGSAPQLLEQYGHLPLPPYIRKGKAGPGDAERYQTVYARQPGSVAAPTAGLHFTERLLAALAERGIDIAFVTLHVGLGTFRPVQVEDYTQHPMHAEWAEVPSATAEAIERCRARGGRIVAVGTTTVRTLESAARLAPGAAWSGETDLFIHPSFEFRVVQGLVTNFHLPQTTLLLLVAALAGVDLTQRAYDTAIAEGYRFYSYGDAMLVL
jgi:S-adenosylmethionine:tRNA ribosyltransferase-isomerase